jgi:AcrR family transcriptional regulator
MARKAVTSGGTRDEILGVAKRLFFEKGFDGVTIRTIQREVGCEVGLFYYYFKSKEQIFDVVLTELQSDWENVFKEVLQKEDGDSVAQLMLIFETAYEIAKEFRGEKAEELHWSVQGAMYNRLAAVIEGYIAAILGSTKTETDIDNKALASIIAGGMCRFAQTASQWEYTKAFDGIYKLMAGLYGDRQRNNSGRRQDISVELL